jgi:hypothetical protein
MLPVSASPDVPSSLHDSLNAREETYYEDINFVLIFNAFGYV